MAEERIVLVAEMRDEATADLDRFNRKLEETGKSAEESNRKVSQSAASTSKGVAQQTGAMQKAYGQLDSTVSQSGSTMASAAAGLDQVGGSAEGAAQRASSSSDALYRLSGGLSGAAPAAEGAAAGLDQLGGAAEGAAVQASASSEALYRLTGGLSGARPAADSVAAGLDHVGASADGAGRQTAASFEAMEFSATELDSALFGIENSFTQADTSARGLLENAAAMKDEFSQVGVALGVVGGATVAATGYVLQAGIAYNTLQQVSGRAMETMTGSAETAAAQMQRLHEFADNSPYARDTWITAQQQLMAFGMEGTRVIPTMEGIQNAVAAMGGGDQEIMQLVDILGTVEGQGKMTGAELQRLGQMGVNAADIIGESMGMSGNEIREQISDGALDAGTAITALTEGMNTRFAGSAEGLRDTYEGALDRIRARVRDFGSVLAAPLVDPNGGGFLVAGINQAADFGSALLELPAPLLQIAGLGIGAAGGISLIGSAIVLAAPHLLAFGGAVKTTWTTLYDFASGASSVAGGLRRIGIAAGIAGAAFIGLKIIGAIVEDSDDFAASASDMGKELRAAASGAEAFTNIQWSRAETGPQSLTETMERLGSDTLTHRIEDGMNRMFHSAFGISGEVTDLDANIANLDESLTSAFTGGRFDEVAAGFGEIKAAQEELDLSADQVLEMYPQVAEAIRGAAHEAGYAASSQEILAIATDQSAMAALDAGAAWDVVADAAANAGEGSRGINDVLREQAELSEAAASSLGEIVDMYFQLGIIQLDASEALMTYNERVNELTTSIDENGNSMNRYTGAGMENQRAFRAVGDAARDLAQANIEAGDSADSVTAGLMGTYDQLYKTALAMTGSESQARDYAASFMAIPEEYRTDVEAYFNDFATAGVQSLGDATAALPTYNEIWFEAQTEDAQSAITALESDDLGAMVKITGDTEMAEMVMENFTSQDHEVLARIFSDAGPAERTVFDFTSGEYIARADIDGNTSPANQAMAAFLNGDHRAVARITGRDSEARATMSAFQNGYYPTTARIVGNDASARGTINSLTATPWRTSITASALTGGAEAALNHAARNRSSTITQVVQRSNLLTNVSPGGPTLGGGFRGGQIGNLPTRANGGRLPYTGLGTDMIVGVNAAGMPLARVDDGEWVINQRSSGKYDRLLAAVNRDDPSIHALAGLAGGGVAGLVAAMEAGGNIVPDSPAELFDRSTYSPVLKLPVTAGSGGRSSSGTSQSTVVQAGAVQITIDGSGQSVESIREEVREEIEEFFEELQRRAY